MINQPNEHESEQELIDEVEELLRSSSSAAPQTDSIDIPAHTAQSSAETGQGHHHMRAEDLVLQPQSTPHHHHSGEPSSSSGAHSASGSASSGQEHHHHHMRAEDLVLQPQSTPHHHHSSASSSSSSSAHHHRHRHHHHHMSKTKRAVLAVALSLLGVLLVAVGTFAVMQEIGRRQMLPSVEAESPLVPPANPDVSASDNGQKVEYQGNTYVFNENRTNILFMGTDQTELGTEDGLNGGGGQADGIFLLSLDTVTGEMDVIAISRDSMAQVDRYAVGGQYIDTTTTQLCLAYAYGDGRESSCENMCKAVSRLLYGLPIQTYYAMDLENIGILNDAIGGVTVTLPEDFETEDGIFHQAGESVTLYGQDAVHFVRYRNTDFLDSNNYRMARQKEYVSAFFAKALQESREDIQVPLSLFRLAGAHSVTSLNATRVAYLATVVLSKNSALQFHTLPGEVVRGEDRYAEYHLDDEQVFELILDIFYTKQ